ncbi:hypothetical protein AB0C96_35830 [Streptomyces sp. NPDC048506]|uniref:hypothetical protein n=1 Tax=Streptomyces sp. NPDC048506 TaxID=3155028 RepID=UPI0034129233
MPDSVLLQTIENLEHALPELEEQERQLRGQLDDVVQRVTAARNALEHLRVLTATATATATASKQSAPLTASPDSASGERAPIEPAVGSGQDSPGTDTAVAPESAGEPGRTASAVPQPRTAAPSAARSSSAKKRTTKKAAAKKAVAPVKSKAKKAASKRAATTRSAEKSTERLIDAALAVLKKSSVPMRAHEINAALGREATPGQIESVRNTLDRVAKQQNGVTRPGRGTYAAV